MRKFKFSEDSIRVFKSLIVASAIYLILKYFSSLEETLIYIVISFAGIIIYVSIEFDERISDLEYRVDKLEKNF